MLLDATALPLPAGSSRTAWLVRVCDVCYADRPADHSTEHYEGAVRADEPTTVCEECASPLDGPTRRDVSAEFRTRRFAAAQARVQPVIDVYRKLCEPRRRGVPAPSSASLVRWEGGSACALCTCSFSLLWGRHHCRLCGRTSCSACAPRRATATGRVRICHDCSRALGVWQAGEHIMTARHEQSQQSAAASASSEAFRALLSIKDALQTALSDFEEQLGRLGRAGCDPGPATVLDASDFVEALIPQAMARLKAYSDAASAERDPLRNRVALQWKGVRDGGHLDLAAWRSLLIRASAPRRCSRKQCRHSIR